MALQHAFNPYTFLAKVGAAARSEKRTCAATFTRQVCNCEQPRERLFCYPLLTMQQSAHSTRTIVSTMVRRRAYAG